MMLEKYLLKESIKLGIDMHIPGPDIPLNTVNNQISDIYIKSKSQGREWSDRESGEVLVHGHEWTSGETQPQLSSQHWGHAYITRS